MDRSVRRGLELVALQLAAIVVGAHLWWAVPRLVGQLRIGSFVDPRPVLFVLSSMAILTGAIYVAVGGRRRPIYVLGIVLMAVYVFGYWGWHLIGHLQGLPWVEGEPITYERNAVLVLVDHLRHDGHALVSKLAETALATVLGALLYADSAEVGRRGDRTDGRTR